MKVLAASLGAAVLNIALIIAGVLLLGLALWILVPAALPVEFTYLNGVATGGLLFVARGVFK